MFNSTIARITAGGLLGRRRSLLLLPLPLMLVLLALIAAHGQVETVMVAFGLAVLVPLTALVAGTGVLSPEIDDGTLLHILAKPLPRAEILLSKLVVAVVVSALVTTPALFVSGLIVDGGAVGFGFAVAGACAVSAYCAVFSALSLLTRRPVLIGLGYVLIWEAMVCNIVSGTGILSIEQYAVSIAHRISGSTLFTANLSFPAALVMGTVVTVGATWLAVGRLSGFEVSNSTN